MAEAGTIADFDALATDKQIDDDANYQWRVARRPVGNVVPEDFAWQVTDIPEPGPGEVLLKTHYLGLAPVMRAYMVGGSPSGESELGLGDLNLALPASFKQAFTDIMDGNGTDDKYTQCYVDTLRIFTSVSMNVFDWPQQSKFREIIIFMQSYI